MKFLVKILTIFALLSPFAVYSAELKIGVVRVESIITEAPQVKAVSAAMEEKFSEQKKELMDMESEIGKLKENYTRNELVMTEDKLNELKNKILSKIQIAKQKEATLSKDVQEMRSKELIALQTTMRDIINDIAKSENYDLILSDGVVFTKEAYDISDKVLDKMKDAFESSKK